MKQRTINTVRIKSYEVLLNGEIEFKARIGFQDISFIVEAGSYTNEDMDVLKLFYSNTHKLVLRYEKTRNGYKYVDLQAIELDHKEIFKPINYNNIKVEPIKYIPLEFGNTKFFVQREGFSVIVAPSGSGKTFNAIHNLPMLSRNFEIILYLNLELPNNDIKIRVMKHHKDFDVDNLFLANTLSMDDILKFVDNKSACVIIDNIDNFIGGGADAFNVQNSFVNKFDRWAKEKGNFGLFLTQFVKENGRDPILKENKVSGGMEIDRSITFNQLSGVAQIARLSRSVIMTYYDFDNDKSYLKVLKKGVGKFENELDREDLLNIIF